MECSRRENWTIHESEIRPIRVIPIGDLFLSVKSLRNNERARLVPAAAVKPALRVVGMIIWLKGNVAG